MNKGLRVLKTGFTCCCLLFSSALFAQPQFEWAKSIGGGLRNRNNSAGMMTTDVQGNLYTMVAIMGFVDFNPANPGIDTYTVKTTRGTTSCILKSDPAGNFVWVKVFEDVIVNSANIDEAGNIYLSGAFAHGFVDTVDFDPGPGVTKIGSNGLQDAFLLKLDTYGAVIWVKAWGGASYDYASSTLDSNGFIYCVGSFQGSVDFDPGSGTTTLSSIPTNKTDAYISKFDTAGNFIWVKSMGGLEDDGASHVKVDASGNVYISGSFKGTADFDPGSGNHYLVTAQNSQASAFITKLSPSGDFMWAQSIINNVYIYQMEIDAFANLILGGEFSQNITHGPVDFDPGSGVFNLYDTVPVGQRFFLLKWDSASNFIWAHTFDFGQNSSCAIDHHGNIFLGGTLSTSVDFDPDPISTYFIDPLQENAHFYIAKYDPKGKFVLAQNFGGGALLPPYSGIGTLSGIHVDYIGNIYTAGSFHYAPRDFDPGPSVLNLSFSGTENGAGAFIQKLSCPAVIENITVTTCTNYDFFGSTLTQSGTYTYANPNVAGGCDSVVELALTIPVIDVALTENAGTITANATGATYQWVDCNTGNVISGETAQSFTPTADGQYAVIITLDACSDTSDCFNFKTAAIQELGTGNLVTLYPNPVENIVHLKTGRALHHATVAIYNITGREVVQQEELLGDRFSFDITTYASGVYFMEIKEQGNVVRLKFTIR